MPQCIAPKVQKKVKRKRSVRVVQPSGDQPTQDMVASSSPSTRSTEIVEVVPDVGDPPLASDPVESLLNTRFHEASHRTLDDFQWAALPRHVSKINFNFVCLIHGLCFKYSDTIVAARPLQSTQDAIAAYYEDVINQFLRCDDAMNHGRVAKLWPCVLNLCYPSIAGLSLCKKLCCLILRGIRNQSLDGVSHFCEVFAGAGHLSRVLLRDGFFGSAFDICWSSNHNALDCKGFTLLMEALLTLRKRGLLWLGTPCSSFTVLCRCQSARAESNSYIGHLLAEFVEFFWLLKQK